MDASSSSKVTVEYHDPSGVFPLLSRDITSRLPLRNLNWQSQARPLRQIKSLHLDFVPDNFTKNSLRPPAQRTESEGTNSFDIVRSGADSRKNAVKERRHQIPGLETSPYLKIYVLRCDDKDTYKATERKKLREWIRDGASSSSKTKGKGENHDAFEWLILHVVIPETLAASEPRWREAPSKDSDELKERPKQGGKWPGKSTRTVFDKLRADFNESGKSGQDRVAQIRLLRDQVPSDLLPTPRVAETLEETPEERGKAWNDLMTKFKTLVLTSFDLRVRQYETDVAEQESRRSLPGFNFCTFFIHKEGLAKALESIGLVEDALVIYDQLSLGLETVLRDIANGKAEGTATIFSSYTDDIKERIIGSKQPQLNGTASDNSTGDKVGETPDASERDYRERIVRSTISVFDFWCYLFSRQKALILRLANASSVRAELNPWAKDVNEDLVLISEVCWRASSFIHNNARTLRQDLLAYRSEKADFELSNADIDSLVSSWTYAVASQILDDTASTIVDDYVDNGRRESLANGIVTGSNQQDAKAYPQRTTSLPPRKSRISELQGRASLQSASENDLVSPPASPGFHPSESSGAQPGLIELVTYRAELVVIRRKMLEHLAKQRGWFAGWALLRSNRVRQFEDIDLNGDTPANADVTSSNNRTVSTLLSPALASALTSEQEYHAAYEGLSNMAMKLFLKSTQTKSAEAIMGDLAILKSQEGDPGYAVSYFQHVLPFYAAEGWSLMEIEALKMHAKCLKELDRREEYVRTLLSLLAKSCEKKKGMSFKRMTFESTDQDVVDVSGILPELASYSQHLESAISTPADDYFEDIRLDREVMHHEGKDGFMLNFHIRHILNDEIYLDEIGARLVSVEDPNQEIWIRSVESLNLKSGINECKLESTAVAFGAFVVDKIVLKAKNVYFEQDLRPKTETQPSGLGISDITEPANTTDAHMQPWVFIYPPQHAFSAELSLERTIHVDRTRHLELKISSGWNNIQNLDLKLRSATAGLRLHLADATFEDIQKRSGENASTGLILLSDLEAYKSALITIPYSLEQATPEIFIRFEARYNTSDGTFVCFSSARIATGLPLDVDVNDTFHLEALFSNFTVRTTGPLPLSITNAELESSAVYDVHAPPKVPMPMTVFDQQPARLLYKITQKGSVADNDAGNGARLSLSLDYLLIQELVISKLRKTFASALEQSKFAVFSRLLIPLFCERSKSSISKADIEMACLLNEIKVPAFVTFSWPDIIKILPATVHKQLTSWLETWHEDNSHVTLEYNEVYSDLHRRITISVEVPRVDVVHKASLSLLEQQQHLNSDPHIVTLGQPLKAQLKLSSTSGWSADTLFGSSKDNKRENDDISNSFVFDVHAEADSWLIGGQRRAQFIAKDDVEQTFEVLLIPLRLGSHLLPQVDIHPKRRNETSDESQTQSLDSPVSCETHYESAGMVVQVVRDLRTARVHIPETKAPSRPSTATTAKEAG